METRSVKSLAEQVRGVSYKPEDLHDKLDDSSLILLRANNIADGKINFDDVVFVDKKKVSNDQLLRSGDILICASSGSKTLVGKAATVDLDKEATFGAFCKVVRPRNNEESDYISLYFQSPVYRRKISSVALGANINNIRNEHIDALTVNWFTKEERREAVMVLRKVESVIRFRKMQLADLAHLIKARFIEMFGDPENNPKEWPIVNISEVISGKASNGFFAKRDDYCYDGNIEVLGVANVVNRMYSGIENLPKTKGTESDIIKFGVRYGDMLFCRSSLVAEGIGKASIVPENVGNSVVFECHVIRLPLDLNKCVPEFMQVFSTTDYFRKQIIAQSKTATMTTIGQDGILKTNILLPPLSEQREFYDFIKQVEKSQFAVQKALDEAQTLFDSLMQKYFG